MISLILTESSLEIIPSELEHHPSVISHARKLDKHPIKQQMQQNVLKIKMPKSQKSHILISVEF